MVTIVPISDFLKRREVAVLDPSVGEKYQIIFKKYPCFTEATTSISSCSSSKPAYIANLHHRKKLTSGPHKYHGHTGNYNKKPIKDPSRAIIGYLNVINIDNYSRVYTKIRLLLDNDNVALIVRDILHKCWTATVFVNVYIKLLADINTIYDIKNTIHQVVTQNIDRFEFKSNISDSYELFCEKQKHKSFMLGLNMTLIKLCKADLISPSVLKDYASSFENRVISENEEYHLDIMIHILIELCKSMQGLIRDPKYLASQINCNIPRIKFLIQELFEIH